MKWNDLDPDRKDRKLTLPAILASLIRKRRLSELLSKAYKLWKRAGWIGIYQRLAMLGHSYKQWVRLYDVLNHDDRQMILDHIAKLEQRPCISVLMSTGNLSERYLRDAIESVRKQLYPNWELCIAEDTASTANMHAVLEEYTNLDARIRMTRREKGRCISAAFNSALEIASGEFVTLLDCHDELSQHALYMVAVAVNEKPQVDLIYSDEDKIDEKGGRCDPYFKPDWDPDLFVAQNVVSHLSVYRTSIVRDVGGFRVGYESWDLTLRVSQRIPAANIHHIPHVLYHGRIMPSPPSIEAEENGDVMHIGTATIGDYLARSGRESKAVPIMGGCFRIKDQVPIPVPLVSIIIPTYNGLSLLIRCIDSIKEKTSYPNYEILVVDNRSDDNKTLEYFDSLEKEGVARVLKYNFPFNYSAINNFAARVAKGEFLCLMNNDIEVISGDWLEEMVSQAVRPGIGAVGAMLYYPDNAIQHAGVLVGMGGVAGHLYAGSLRGTQGYKYRACLAQTLSAVTAACLVVRTQIYLEVGGLDEKNLAVAFNDVDFCLRVKEGGYRNFWTPFAEFYHHESASRGLDDHGEKLVRFQSEIAYMCSRWGHVLGNDPAYNPNLTLDYAYPLPSFPPRIEKPWRK
ncbi:MAG: glycosyltransferase family 2 protein [Gammaproteobacteria bacterium]|nr:glycosyltransferase family 2 protein [Gammaproteobacteria bacterium]MBU1978765.1 glycosyltransferase family 2 protein [Gammaproteobacteria bacterium]